MEIALDASLAMNILFLTQVLPYPLDSGPKTRAYFILRYLSQRCRVTLISFKRPDDPPASLDHLRQFCAQVYTVPMLRSRVRDARALAHSYLGGPPFLIGRDFVPQMAQKVAELVRAGQYTAVHADQLWMAQYVFLAERAAQAAGAPRPRLVLDAHNAYFQIVQRLAQGERNPLKRLGLEVEWRRLRRWEARALARFDQVVTVTEPDRRILAGLLPENGPRPPLTTIPICIDPDETPPVQPAPGAGEVLHLGTMFWPPNIEGVLWFIRETWPLVRAQLPQARLTLVGKNPPAALERLAAPGSGIQLTGYVANPQPYLERAGVFIVPLLSGGGMRVKIVDAWRWGLPVVSTSIGAEGLEFREGEHLLLADTPVDFAQAVLRVLNEPGLAHRLRREGRRWVEEQYAWQRVYPAWDRLYPNK